MENTIDIFTRLEKDAEVGFRVAGTFAKIGKPAVDVFKSMLFYEVVGPCAQKIIKIPSAIRRFRYVPPFRR